MGYIIGDRVKLKREELGITARRLAELANCTPSAIGQLESGKSDNPTMKLLSKLSEVFNVSIDWLVNGEQEILNKQEYYKLDEFERRFILEYIDFCLKRKNEEI
ncbi:helix-turn-helix domain-containing protein [Paenibacillus sp. FSL H7-0331]|uniref:helix-turn-helix domain-containing protein n=1 Tax=Paenibacillus sp. FSL H7-0331 TaxID=1920421 RepID=UPI00096F6D34|nr:helix-turn-helix transcriptional regulator [Paenibacillus sp. FSL H7-0331]OMF10793.1 hypothetical protein BK127_26715 [Paenibacillus sp. FSL H7-0331]